MQIMVYSNYNNKHWEDEKVESDIVLDVGSFSCFSPGTSCNFP